MHPTIKPIQELSKSVFQLSKLSPDRLTIDENFKPQLEHVQLGINYGTKTIKFVLPTNICFSLEAFVEKATPFINIDPNKLMFGESSLVDFTFTPWLRTSSDVTNRVLCHLKGPNIIKQFTSLEEELDFTAQIFHDYKIPPPHFQLFEDYFRNRRIEEFLLHLREHCF